VELKPSGSEKDPTSPEGDKEEEDGKAAAIVGKEKGNEVEGEGRKRGRMTRTEESL